MTTQKSQTDFPRLDAMTDEQIDTSDIPEVTDTQMATGIVVKRRTITLTDRPPVRIREDQWPIVAHGNYEDFDNQYKFQANRTTDIDIRVRMHTDGRAIVYGTYDYSTRFQQGRGLVVRSGKLCDPGADLPSAIREVGEQLIERLQDRADATNIRDVIAECIAKLPAVELE